MLLYACPKCSWSTCTLHMYWSVALAMYMYLITEPAAGLLVVVAILWTEALFQVCHPLCWHINHSYRQTRESRSNSLRSTQNNDSLLFNAVLRLHVHVHFVVIYVHVRTCTGSIVKEKSLARRELTDQGYLDTKQALEGAKFKCGQIQCTNLGGGGHKSTPWNIPWQLSSTRWDTRNNDELRAH